ncbi:MAG: FAD:protein FMN transferase [Puniceicoccaceae bacterium]
MSSEPLFSHEAMNTTFTLRISGESEQQAAGVARECFEHLDYLENKLSRYREGSDVWQINHLATGESLFLSEACYECLRLAMEANEATGGLFDVTIGGRIEFAKSASGGQAPELKGRLMLNPDKPCLHCMAAGREIDLGGIGKGFALDQMKDLLLDWGIESALLAAGASTHLAMGPRTWPLSLSGDSQTVSFPLTNAALSASGLAVQGSHILAPDGSRPDYTFKRVWISLASAALTDAWSTAAMLMNPPILRELLPPGALYMVETKDALLGNFQGLS